MMRVRKEYGEPFKDVVIGFAEQGCSRRLTAATLQISLSYFRQLLTRYDLHKYFKPQKDMIESCKGGQYQGSRGQKGRGRIGMRNPIYYKGEVYFPGEPMHHYLYEKRKGERVHGDDVSEARAHYAVPERGVRVHGDLSPVDCAA